MRGIVGKHCIINGRRLDGTQCTKVANINAYEKNEATEIPRNILGKSERRIHHILFLAGGGGN